MGINFANAQGPGATLFPGIFCGDVLTPLPMVGAAVSHEVVNYAPPGHQDTVIFELGGAGGIGQEILTGLAGGKLGRVILIRGTPVGDFDIVFESASSATANRFNMNVASLTFTAFTTQMFYYGRNNRWNLVGNF